MRRFRYPLQAILTLRQREEQVAMDHYAICVRDREAARSEVDRSIQIQADVTRNYLERLGTGARVGTLTFDQIGLDYAKQQTISKQRCFKDSEHRVQQALTKLTVARKNREVVEKLLGYRLDDHRRAELREEMMMLDELSARKTASLITSTYG